MDDSSRHQPTICSASARSNQTSQIDSNGKKHHGSSPEFEIHGHGEKCADSIQDVRIGDQAGRGGWGDVELFGEDLNVYRWTEQRGIGEERIQGTNDEDHMSFPRWPEQSWDTSVEI